MNTSSAIIIHPNDQSTEFLRTLYDCYNSHKLLTEADNDESITKTLTDEGLSGRTIMMLGHGCSMGLFAPQMIENDSNDIIQFGRLIINSSHVQLLKDRQCVGIWCYAVDFARKYNLHGLFSGMIISELCEAQSCGIYEFSEAEIHMYNQDFAEALTDCIKKYPLNEVPEAMEHYIQNPNRLELFNYSNLYYL